jgi:hypothetical protein
MNQTSKLDPIETSVTYPATEDRKYLSGWHVSKEAQIGIGEIYITLEY